MVSDTTYSRLSPNRKHVIDTLSVICEPWVNEVMVAVEDAFFEKAARIIYLKSPKLARKMLEG